MRLKVRYTCRGCGYRWVREVKAPLALIGKLRGEVRFSVPADKAPCCSG